MDVIRLPLGEQAPVDTDCVRIEEQPDSTYRLTASALCSDADEGESVSIVGAPSYPSVAEAEAAGIAWANDVGVERLFVSVGTLACPLKPVEIDKPL